MNKKLLLKALKRSKTRLKELRTRIEKNEVREEEFEDVKTEVEELVVEVNEIVEAINELEEEVEAIEDDESRDGTAEDEELQEEVQEEVTELTEEVQALAEALANLEEEVEAVEEERSKKKSQKRSAASAIKKSLSTRNAQSSKKRDVEIRKAFANFVVGNISEVEARSLGIVTGQGSVTVPVGIAAEIITYAQEENLLRKYGTTHTTKGNVKYPILVKKAVANVTKTERSTGMPETDIEFDEILLDPAEFDALATASKKLIKMSGVNIEDIVIEELKKAYVDKEIDYMFKGDDVGHKNPGSLANKAVGYYETSVISLATDGWSQKLYSQLVKLKGQPVTAVLKNAMWIVNRAALTVLEEMTDANGRPLLHEAADGIGYKFLGHPLDFTDAADGKDSTKPVFYFGDFKSFHIQDVDGQLEIQRLVEQYANQNKIGFQIYNLLDGQLVYSPLEPSVYRYEVGATAPLGD